MIIIQPYPSQQFSSDSDSGGSPQADREWYRLDLPEPWSPVNLSVTLALDHLTYLL